MKLKLIAAGLLLGAALAVPTVPALSQGLPGPTASPSPGATVVTVGATPSVAITPVAQTGEVVAQQKPGSPTLAPTRPPVTSGTQTTPRAGGLPMSLAIPLLAGGAAALGGGLYLLRRGRRH